MHYLNNSPRLFWQHSYFQIHVCGFNTYFISTVTFDSLLGYSQTLIHHQFQHVTYSLSSAKPSSHRWVCTSFIKETQATQLFSPVILCHLPSQRLCLGVTVVEKSRRPLLTFTMTCKRPGTLYNFISLLFIVIKLNFLNNSPQGSNT